MNTVLALSNVVIKELYRRKDFYVLFVLTAVITLVMGFIRFFNDPRIVGYLKEICLLLVWISALIIAITTAARQIPAECENRTIFPLLAKPVTRAQVMAGKFLGCWLATGMALLVFYVFFGVMSGAHDNRWPVLNYLQAFWLQWMMLAVVVALVLFGSVVFSAPSANVTICLFVVLGIVMVGGHLNQVALQQDEPVKTITYAVYFLLPHLEWFDSVRDRLLYSQPLIAWRDCVLATLYAMVYAVIFLFSGWLVFRRKALTA
jgi:ABC-type transport system involved in multi-copper enzyme maturation permease subunit